MKRWALPALALTLVLGLPPSLHAQAKDTLTVALVSHAPTLDPHMHFERVGILVNINMYDSLLHRNTKLEFEPSLATSWKALSDTQWEFKIRKGVKFHNGETLTPEDVKYSFERYQGASAGLLKAKVARVDVVDPLRVRFVLKQPWPDFLTFYATPATGAAWIVPQKYIEKVGEEGFKKQPVGLGPYRFVRMTPGVELVLEANDRYWRKTPSVRRVVIKGVPDRTTRLAMLKTGEADIAYLMIGIEAELYAFIAASAFALGRMAYDGKLFATLGTSLRLVTNPMVAKDKRQELAPELLTEMRFGPAIFVGMLGTAFLQWRHL